VPAVRRNKTLEVFWALHKGIFRLSGGRLGTKVGALESLMLTTIGRRSGEERRVMLNFVREGENFVVVATNTGEDRNPPWVFNLRAQPKVEIQVGRETIPVLAHEAGEVDRERLYAAFVERDKSYAEYPQRTTREIPVVIFEPVTPVRSG
jgi:F420H(2)-dependent quinone reductase